MKPWWEIDTSGPPPVARAVAYYRHSAQDRQENSIPIQREQVRQWAAENGVEIVHEFCDHGKSGLTAEGRPAFTDMMENWVKTDREDFELILCLDVSRWGRFQDIDCSALYSSECKKHGKEVIYTTIGMPKKGDQIHPLYVQFERFRAAQYSRELSTKVFNGCVYIAKQGYSAGGAPPYGLSRLLLDERREPVQVLEPGQHKSIQNQRVTLVGGPKEEVSVIRRIFHEFVELGHSEYRIAEGLNDDGIPSPKGHPWGAGMVLDRLHNEKYAGTMVYNVTSSKLKSKTHHNPPEEWVRTPEAFQGIISPAMFLQVQEIFLQRRRKYDPEMMLGQLGGLYKEHGMFRSSLLRLDKDIPPASAFARHFGSFDGAIQQLHAEERNRVRETVQEQIRQHVPEVLPYADFFVLDQKLTVAIQPSVPVPRGYAVYWPFRPDDRQVIDLTLGVILSAPTETEILGYIAMPRLLDSQRTVRVSSSSARVDMFGRCDLGFLQQLLEGDPVHGHQCA